MGRRKQPGSFRSEAERLSGELGYRVSARAVETWKGKGYNLEDTQDLARNLLGQPRPPVGLVQALEEGRFVLESDGGEFEEMTTAEAARRLKIEQVRRTAAEARIKEQQASREEGRSMLTEEVEKAGVGIGVVVGQGLAQLENELPAMLEGLPAPKIKRVIREAARNLRREWSDYVEDTLSKLKEGDEQRAN